MTQHAYRDGYKAHVAAEPDTGLITACALTAGNTGDAEAAPDLLADEPAGTEVLGDSAYGTGELRHHLAEQEMTAVIKPPPLRPAVEGGYTLDDFDIDETAGTVTCPAGITVDITPRRNARFGRRCTDCLLRSRCTTATRGRVIVLHPHHGLLAAARAFAATDAFDTPYRQHRPMVDIKRRAGADSWRSRTRSGGFRIGTVDEGRLRTAPKVPPAGRAPAKPAPLTP